MTNLTPTMFLLNAVSDADEYQIQSCPTACRSPYGENGRKEENKMKPTQYVAVFVAMIAMCRVEPVAAVEFRWNEPAGGEWCEPSNWTPEGLPGPGDDVFIDAGGAYTIELNKSTAVGTLTIVNPAAELWINGNPNDVTLTVLEGGNNHGTIRLESFANRMAALRNSGATLVNEEDGQLLIKPGLGGIRRLDGNLENRGQIILFAGETLSVNGGLPNSTLTQTGDGSIDAQDRLTIFGGRFEFLGGMVQGHVYIRGAELLVGSDVVSESTVFVDGENNTLIDNGSSNVTVWIDGIAGNGNASAVLNLAENATNAGTIRLETRSGFDNINMVGLEDNPFVNNGLIDVRVGDGGARRFFGDLENHGRIRLPSEITMPLDGDFTQAESGVMELEISGANSFSRIPVTGFAALSGGIDVTVVDQFVPILGESFPLVTFTAGTVSMAQSNIMPANLPEATCFDVAENPNDLSLVLTDQCISPGDSDGDGVPNDIDACPNSSSDGGVDEQGRPLGDLDGDCDVDLFDYAVFTRNFSGHR